MISDRSKITREKGDVFLAGEGKICDMLHRDPEKGVEAAMKMFLSFVYAIVRGKLSSVGTVQDIEECVSDVFYELYRTAASVNAEKGTLKGYIAVLARRRAVDAYRRLAAKSGEIPIDELEGVFPSGDSVEQKVLESEKAGLLIDEIKALGKPDSEIIIRKYYYGETSKEISKSTGLKVGNIDKRASRAVLKLRNRLEEILYE